MTADLSKPTESNLESSVQFSGSGCFFTVKGFLSSNEKLHLIEKDLKTIEDNKDWLFLVADFTGIDIKSEGALPTFFATIVMRLAHYSQTRRAKWLLVLSDHGQADVIHFVKWRSKRFVNSHIVYAAARVKS